MKQLQSFRGVRVGFTALLLLTGRACADKVLLFAGGGASALPAPAKEAALREPFGTGFDENGNAWIVEMASGNRLLKLSGDGVLTHIAGRCASPPR